ncbi:transposase IS4 family protein [Bacillus sp. OxB-1]|uniref:hypothetical protein n=1 Tax=Bacillus sp. (strain OxB-1) TaxID=98228 RepID=UPI0005820C10|nr:hypothetical protein [Bacillus sp. OxB-1]BAQ09544.1 transposase IS4 family protein [Bacillus sp. OxB-1]
MFTIQMVTRLTNEERPKALSIDDSAYDRCRSKAGALLWPCFLENVLLQKLVKSIVEQSLDVIGMVKETKQRYIVNGETIPLKRLHQLAEPAEFKKGILRSIHTVGPLLNIRIAKFI